MESSSPSIFRSWINVLTQPGEEVFIQEGRNPNATLSTALMWMLVAGLVIAIVQILGIAIVGSTQLSAVMEQLDSFDMPPQQQAQFASALDFFFSPTGLIMIFVLTVVLTIVIFLLGVGLTHIVSKIFGGQGTFGRTAYLQSLFVAPLGILLALFGMIPFIGICLSLIVIIYNAILWFFSTKAEHNLTMGKTVGVTIVTSIAMFSVFVCVSIAAGTVVAGMTGAMPQ